MSKGAHLNRVKSGTSRVRMLGDGHGGRQKDDFYATPARGIAELLNVEQFTGPIWEPAAGDGAISKALEAKGYEVWSSDLVDRGYGEPGIDFLLEWRSRAPNIITNPPFKLAVPFAQKALDLTTGKVAMLLKLAFLEGQTRAAFFADSPLARVWVFSQRLTFTGCNREIDGTGMMAFAWFVWEHGYQGRPQLGWLPDRHYDAAKNSRDSYDLAIAEMRRTIVPEARP